MFSGVFPEASVSGSIFSLRVRGGLKFDIVKSGVQKGIRRALPDVAVPLALRGLELGLKVKTAYSNLMNRLIVIAGEDIGPACLPALVKVDQEVSMMRDGREGGDVEALQHRLSDLVGYMCAQKKSRYCSYLRNYYFTALMNPEYRDLIETDVLNEFERVRSQPASLFDLWRLGRESKYPYISLNFALTAMLSKEKIDGDVFELEGKKTRQTPIVKMIWLTILREVDEKFRDLVKLLYRWFKNENEEHIYLVLAHVILIQSELCGMVENLHTNDHEEIWREMAFKRGVVIPEFVMDRHTQDGKRRGANKLDFALVGAVVENEARDFQSDVLQRVYVEVKRRQTSTETPRPRSEVKTRKFPMTTNFETGVFDEMCRDAVSRGDTLYGQKLTSRNKPVTYIIRSGDLAGTVMKGPYPCADTVLKLWSRFEGFRRMGCDVLPLKILKDVDQGLWVSMTVMARAPPNEWTFEEVDDSILGRKIPRLVRESLGSNRLLDKPLAEIEEVLFGERFLYRDYLIAACMGAGDQGHWNCLTMDGRSVLIDYEDSSTRKKITHPSFVFAKCSSRGLRDLFERGFETHREKIRDVAREIESQKETLLRIGAWDPFQAEMVLNYIR